MLQRILLSWLVRRSRFAEALIGRKGGLRKMDFALESANADWVRFWDLIEAEGDLDKALACWDIKHNTSA